MTGWGRFGKFCGILTLESFASTSLGLAVGSFAPSTDAALAIGPGVMVLFIVVSALSCIQLWMKPCTTAFCHTGSRNSHEHPLDP